MKFCCDKFRFFYSGEKSMGLNIRIVKFNKGFVQRSQLDFDINYLITDGYNDNIDNSKKMVVKYCPFCGEDLKKRYNKDEYVQEIISPT